MGQAASSTGPSRTLASALAVLAIVVLTGAQSSCRERASSDRASPEPSGSVVYSVASNAGIETVSFIGSDGRTKTDTNVGRSWSGRGPAKHGVVRVSATTSRDDAWIKCSVEVEGRITQQASAQGTSGSRVVCETRY